MNEYAETRCWRGVNDPVHPLCRTAHAAVAYGRFIYILNGYTPTREGMCLFNRAGLTRYDPLTGSVCCLPVHWDCSSIKRHGFGQPFVSTSGSAVALRPETEHSLACIYSFAGFSLLGSFHTNALVQFELPRTSCSNSPDGVQNTVRVQLQPPCCRATVISGHGLMSYLFSISLESLVTKALIFTVLESLQRQISHYGCLRSRTTEVRPFPSPRDKLCMEYWHGCLYAFGGYGPNFKPPAYWPSSILCWPFLYDSENPHEWFPCEQDRGWNNQLLVYNIHEQYWTLVGQNRITGQPPTARAAHQSSLYAQRGWMLIFGGRGPPVSTSPSSARFVSGLDVNETYESGRLNDLYCLNLGLLEWTRVLTPLDIPDVVSSCRIWPSGRSWTGMDLTESCRINWSCILPEGKSRHVLSSDPEPALVVQTVNLFIVGGFSNANQALSDGYLLQLGFCHTHNKLEARVVAECTPEPHSTSDVTCSPLAPPQIIDGFVCPVESSPDDSSFLTVSRKGRHFSVCETQRECIVTHDYDSSILDREIAYHLSIYSEGTFSPRHYYRRQTSPKPIQSFYHIARFHTDLVLFLLSQFALFDCCHPPSGDSLNAEEFELTRIKISDASATLLVELAPSTQIISFFIRTFPRFMLSWEPLLMVLREKDAWLPESIQKKLLDDLFSQHSGSPLDTLDLTLADQALFDKLALLLPLEKLRAPLPFYSASENVHNGLSYHIQHCILSFLLWSGKSPLNASTNDLWALPNPVEEPNHNVLVSQLPAPRFWHSVTYALDGHFYVIGGSTAEAAITPVERYRLVQPVLLTISCFKQLASHIWTYCLAKNRQDKNSPLRTPVRRKFAQSTLFLHSSHCPFQSAPLSPDFSDVDFQCVLTEHLERTLLQWLM
ncbi:unnamed protein product [Calicophoron daubneyi]|uniref:Uncharacterized protein n=1 Tax=Calicophoron daubneyi TaxID=300641 RepID=A0AAV2TP18_CALDB